MEVAGGSKKEYTLDHTFWLSQCVLFFGNRLGGYLQATAG